MSEPAADHALAYATLESGVGPFLQIIFIDAVDRCCGSCDF